MSNVGFVFIPDISGFTKFVNRTEIRHSRHIISELLEVILESNTLALKVSEIEGDAVLFYQLNKTPSLSGLFNQVRSTFVNFHRFLESIERERVCLCGACTTATNLTLKFIAHSGNVEEIVVGDFLKIFGSDVILAHRLLKNRVPDHEYLLVTNSYLSGQSESPTSAQIEAHGVEHGEDLPDFGAVQGTYFPISALKDTTPAPDDTPRPYFSGRGFTLSTHIKAPIRTVHDVLVDHNLKRFWIPGIRSVEGASGINRIGSRHTCVFDDQEIQVVTVGHKVDPTRFTYSEVRHIRFGHKLLLSFKLSEASDGTRLVLRNILHDPLSRSSAGVTSVLKRMRTNVLALKVRRRMNGALKGLKGYCESRV